MAAEQEAKRGVYVNKPALTALAQYGQPSRIFQVFLVINKSEKVKSFDLPSSLPALEPVEEIAHMPNVLDVETWVNSIDDIKDAIYAAQVAQLIYSRLPESYRQKINN